MKYLILARHAKSSWNHPHLDDHERPLNKRGLRDAPLMARRLQSTLDNYSLNHSLVLTSTAARAKHYAQIIANETNTLIIEQTDLYTFSAASLLRSIRDLPQEFDVVTVVAHNPAITAVADALSKQHFDNIPTSAYVLLECKIKSWEDIINHSHKCCLFDYPKKETTHNE